MKKSILLLVVIVMSFVVFTSCEEENFETGINRNDNPPSGLYQNENDYGSFSEVYIEKNDIEKVKYFGNYGSGDNTYFDAETGLLTRNIYSQDYFKIPAKKYFGLFWSQICISRSTEFYIISASELSQVKEIVERKGFSIVGFDGRNNINYQWKTISGAR